MISRASFANQINSFNLVNQPKNAVLALTNLEKFGVKSSLIEANLPRPYFDQKLDLRNHPEQYESFLSTINTNLPKAQSIISDHLMKNDAFRSIISDFNSGKSAHFLLRNTPLEDSIKTPEPFGFNHAEKPEYSREWFILGLASLMGSPMTYTSTKNGQVLHTIAPDVMNTSSPTSAGSDGELVMHVDSSARDYSPNTLMLSCSRPDFNKMAITSVYPVNDMLPHLTSSEIDILSSARFAHQKPAVTSNSSITEHTEDSYDSNQKPQPVLYKQPDGSFQIDLTFNGTQVFENTYPNANTDFAISKDEAQQALDKIKQVANEIKHDYKLDTGDVMAFANDKALHSRSKFLVNRLIDNLPVDLRDKHEERWLTRVYIKDTVPTNRYGNFDQTFKQNSIQGIAIKD